MKQSPKKLEDSSTFYLENSNDANRANRALAREAAQENIF